MISEDFAFYGFDETSWNRLVSLFLGDERERAAGVLVLLVDAARNPVACFHTATGLLDPASLPAADDLGELCQASGAGACIVMRDRAMADVADYLAEPLDPKADFASRVMRFAHVLRELGNGNWLRVWPNPLPDVLLSAAPAAKPAIDFFLPNGTSVLLGVFEDGALFTGAVVRRNDGRFDVFAGPDAISEWAGPLGGDWRRDHRVLTRAVEKELGPLHVGLFMERETARALLTRRQAGEWAMAYATRGLMVHPFPGSAAAGLGVDVLGGVAEYALHALDQMEPEELLEVAQGFWRGLTDGKGLEGLLGFSPAAALSGALKKTISRPPPTPEPDSSASGGQDPDPLN